MPHGTKREPHVCLCGQFTSHTTRVVKKKKIPFVYTYDAVWRRAHCIFFPHICFLNFILSFLFFFTEIELRSFVRKLSTFLKDSRTLFLNWEEKAARRKWNWPRSDSADWTPQAAKKRSVSRWACKNKVRTNSLRGSPCRGNSRTHFQAFLFSNILSFLFFSLEIELRISIFTLK